MSSKWRHVVFGDMVELVSTKVPAKTSSIKSYISTENMRPNFGGISPASSIPTSGSVAIFDTGDILFSNIRTYFKKVWQAKFAGTCSPDVLVMRPKYKEQLDGKYLYHICRWNAFTDFSVRTSKGVKMPRGDKDALSTFLFPLPEIVEQYAISGVINSIDERIDHNIELAGNLEAIIRRLFKSWFVDFSPVRAKAAGENPPGLADDIAALFPDRFVDSEFGAIPEGWRRETLASVARLNPEAWTTQNHPDEIHYLDLSNVKNGIIEAPTKYSWEAAPSRARRMLQKGDTIIGTVRPGNCSFALIDQAGLTGSTGFAVLRPASDIYREFMYLAATSDDAIDRLAHLADGAAYPAVRPEIVLATETIFPGQEVMTAFSSVTKGMIDRASVCKQEANVLAGIRDQLILRLVSGKLRVADAESLIEEAIV